MGTWGELAQELHRRRPEEGAGVYDTIRREALQSLSNYTGRNAILYATGHLQGKSTGNDYMILDEDMEGFMEVIYQLGDGNLDLILHSPGGVADAADSIVQYLRSKYTHIRVIVPHMAMSAATMIACAANRILMGRHSHLGPIDPQFVFQLELGVTAVPAWAVLKQFDRAKMECGDQSTLSVWYPILKQYGPALLVQCENAILSSQRIVTEWLIECMLADQPDRLERASQIASELGDHGVQLSHGRPLGRDYLRRLGLVIDDLEADQQLQDRVLTVYHAAMLTFQHTGALKVIENNLGRRFVKVLPLRQQAPDGGQGARGGDAPAVDDALAPPANILARAPA